MGRNETKKEKQAMTFKELKEIFEDDTGKEFDSLDDSVELQNGLDLDSRASHRLVEAPPD